MNELEKTLAAFVQQAKEAIAKENYTLAKDRLLNAQKCALLQAKAATGAVRDKALATAKGLKALYDQIEAKAQAADLASAIDNAPKAPAAHKAPAAPKAPADNGNADEGTGNAGSGAYTPPKRNDALSPLYLSDYIGQPDAVLAVRDMITAARLKNAAMQHLIIYGSHGLGKTTFSKIIANELQVGFTEINVTKITPPDMIAILKKLQPRQILFIDEIHTLPLNVAESILYSAMQDGRITYTVGRGSAAKTETVELVPFTLVGATTELGKLAKPFTQRAVTVRLHEYTDEVLAGIIQSSFKKLGVTISAERALTISKRCRNNPRIANNNTKRISDKALVRYAKLNHIEDPGAFSSVEKIRALNIEINDAVIEEFFKENGIDEYGLEGGDRELLKLIIHRYNGGPVGIDTLARAMNESNNVIAQKYEAYLIKKGMLRVDKDGRVAMALAYKALGLPVPPEKEDQVLKDTTGTGGFSGNAGNNNDTTLENKPNTPPAPNGNAPKRTVNEKRSVTVYNTPDDRRCRKVEELIVYPANVKTFESGSLDEMFPDVEQPFEAEVTHNCELELNFGTHTRTLICDSKLECNFASAMAGVGFMHDIKAQTLEIPYYSGALANRRYFPDFVVKDFKDRIVVIEMKNFMMLSYHLNIDKYEELKRYCETAGYGYAEIAKEYDAEDYVSVEMLKNAPVNRDLEAFIIARIEENGTQKGDPTFREADLTEYCETHGRVERRDVYTVLLNNRDLKNVDRVGNDIKITLN